MLDPRPAIPARRWRATSNAGWMATSCRTSETKPTSRDVNAACWAGASSPRWSLPTAAPRMRKPGLHAGLRQRTVHGGIAWTLVTRVATQIASYAVSVALARLLMPADFGLVGMIQGVHRIRQCLHRFRHQLGDRAAQGSQPGTALEWLLVDPGDGRHLDGDIRGQRATDCQVLQPTGADSDHTGVRIHVSVVEHRHRSAFALCPRHEDQATHALRPRRIFEAAVWCPYYSPHSALVCGRSSSLVAAAGQSPCLSLPDNGDQPEAPASGKPLLAIGLGLLGFSIINYWARNVISSWDH